MLDFAYNFFGGADLKLTCLATVRNRTLSITAVTALHKIRCRSAALGLWWLHQLLINVQIPGVWEHRSQRIEGTSDVSTSMHSGGWTEKGTSVLWGSGQDSILLHGHQLPSSQLTQPTTLGPCLGASSPRAVFWGHLVSLGTGSPGVGSSLPDSASPLPAASSQQPPGPLAPPICALHLRGLPSWV